MPGALHIIHRVVLLQPSNLIGGAIAINNQKQPEATRSQAGNPAASIPPSQPRPMATDPGQQRKNNPASG